MNESRVTERAKDAGALGRYLKERLDFFDVSSFPKYFDEQISFVYKPTWNGRRPFPLARAALSFLAADVPVQVVLPPTSLQQLVEHTAPAPDLPPRGGRPDLMVIRKRAEKAFPYKPNPQSVTKVNVYLDEVGRDCWSLDRNFCYGASPYLDWLASRGAYNDAATSFLLYSWCLKDHLPNPFRWAASVVADQSYAKGLSTFLKSVGANSSPLGAMMVEGDTLLGRGVGAIDLVREAKNRCSLPYIREHMLAEYDPQRLRRAIRRILELEIRKDGDTPDVRFNSLEEHWESRWAWAVNGSHSSLVDKRLRPGHEKHPDIHRYHRRAWLEDMATDPRPDWDGYTSVSASPKLEHGKTRAIFACDTVNYLAFEHLMSGVEKAWRGQRVILNPGHGGHLGMAERVAKLRNRSGISLMLDYDDFNSHHSHDNMVAVIAETCDYVGYPADLRDKLIKSLSMQHIYVKNNYIGVSAGTLMSGHRCTTYFNSILNLAYLMCELGEDWMLDKPSLHVGDDVYLGVRSYREAGHVIQTVMNSRLRMNPKKQSVGHISTEFLRVASSARSSYGYLARAVASCVSGNWVSETRLDPFEGLTSMVATARSLANRGHSATVPLLLRSSVKRILGPDRPDDSVINEILSGSVAINNGPQYVSGGTYRYVQVTPEVVSRDTFGYAPLTLNATHDYLRACATPLEVDVLVRAGVSVEGEMEMSSYSKTLKFHKTRLERLRFAPVVGTPAVGSVSAESLLRTPAPRGLLSPYPLLTLAKSRLPEHLVREALASVGGNPNTRQLELDAWGEYRHGCIVNTVLSYGDASSLGKRTDLSVLTSTRRCYI